MYSIDADTQKITVIAKDTMAVNFSLDDYVLSEGDVVYFTVASKLEQETPELQKVITTFNEAGEASIKLESKDTDLPVGTYYYDIQVNTKTGLIDTVVGPAKFVVKGGVTY